MSVVGVPLLIFGIINLFFGMSFFMALGGLFSEGMFNILVYALKPEAPDFVVSIFPYACIMRVVLSCSIAILSIHFKYRYALFAEGIVTMLNLSAVIIPGLLF